jgi:hypothetical protein
MAINDGDPYTTAFPTGVATNRQPQTDGRYTRLTDSKTTHTMPSQIRGENEKQIFKPVTKNWLLTDDETNRHDFCRHSLPRVGLV